jgi:hypothetical protein
VTAMVEEAAMEAAEEACTRRVVAVQCIGGGGGGGNTSALAWAWEKAVAMAVKSTAVVTWIVVAAMTATVTVMAAMVAGMAAVVLMAMVTAMVAMATTMAAVAAMETAIAAMATVVAAEMAATTAAVAGTKAMAKTGMAGGPDNNQLEGAAEEMVAEATVMAVQTATAMKKCYLSKGFGS